MTDSIYDAIKKRCEVAPEVDFLDVTQLSGHCSEYNIIASVNITKLAQMHEFIAHARTDIPSLLKALEVCNQEGNFWAKQYDPNNVLTTCDHWLKEAQKELEK